MRFGNSFFRLRHGLALALGLTAVALVMGGALAASTVDPAFEPILTRLAADGLPETKLRRLFSRAGPAEGF